MNYHQTITSMLTNSKQIMSTDHKDSDGPASSPWPDRRNPLPARPARATKKQASTISTIANKQAKQRKTELAGCWDKELHAHTIYNDMQDVENDMIGTSTEKSLRLQATVEALEANI